MSSVDERAATTLRYIVYEASAFGVVRQAGMLDATSDQEALKQARRVLPDRPGEVRQGNRVICRFGRANGLMLQHRAARKSKAEAAQRR